MAIPFIEECNQSMSSVATYKGEIVAALEAIQELTGDETWKSGKAEAWETDLNGFVTDALAALGDPLDEAKSECRANAAKWQAESANPGGGGTN